MEKLSDKIKLILFLIVTGLQQFVWNEEENDFYLDHSLW